MLPRPRPERCSWDVLLRQWPTGGMLAVTGMLAARNTARTVIAPTTALPRASGMKLYLRSTVAVTLQMM
jgi:hypothetical protein